MGSADTLANSHSTFALRIENDVERPLREFVSTNRKMSAMSTIQGNLQSLAQDVERAQQKADKMRGRDGGANTGDVESAMAQWQSQAPYVFENLQALDEARIATLRDALTQFQTHEMDQVERNRVSGEQCLNVLLNVETADEIKTFAQKAAQGRATPARPQRNSLSYGTPSRGISAPGGAFAPTPLSASSAPARSEEDLTRERTGSTDDTKKGRFKGLKRFGTVMGRNKRESKLPSEFTSPSESPAPARPRPSPLNSFGNRFGRSRDAAPTLQTMQETSPRERPSEPERLGSEIFQSPSEARADPSTPPIIGRSLDLPTQTNGTSLAASILPQFESSGEQTETRSTDVPTSVIPERKESLMALEGRTDSEGFSVPQRGLDPISQAQQDAAVSDDGTAPQFNVNIRDAPIQDSSATSDADLAGMANKLVSARFYDSP